MTRTCLTFALAAAAALAGCDTETIVGGPGADEGNTVVNTNVQLPPSIAASTAYRCRDNSLVYIDWLSDGSARVKKDRNEVGTAVAAPDVATTLSGDPQSPTITYNGQTCRA